MQASYHCPNCGSPLREDARFCTRCGSAATTEPMEAREGTPAASERTASQRTASQRTASQRTAASAVTRPLSSRALAQSAALIDAPEQIVPPAAARPEGAVIAGRYLVTGLRFDDGRLFSYPVVEFHVPHLKKALQCPNPACGAVHWPAACTGDYPAVVCNLCCTPLELGRYPELVLNEALDARMLGRASEVAGLGLVHAGLRAPLFAAVEEVCGQPRALVVEPRVSPLPDVVERQQVLGWLPGLAAALDYLHFRGVTFRGQARASCFGLSGEQAVWSNFADCAILPKVNAIDRAADVGALAGWLFAQITGREQFAPDPALSDGLNVFFSQALAGPGFASGEELIRGLEHAQQEARPADPVEFRFARRTDVGRLRVLNEDSLLTITASRVTTANPRPIGLFVIADGMGGHAAGEVASAAIVDFVQERCMADLGSASCSAAPFDWQRWLQALMEQVNKHVFDLRMASGSDMGSTIVIALLDGAHAYISHIGDSRAYRVNQRGIRRLTEDHSLVERLVAAGQIRPEEARHHPQKNVVYRTVGNKARVDVETCAVELMVGDRLLLCSDGLSGMLLDAQIQQIVLRSANPQSACDALTAAANSAGGDDNISVILVEIARG